MPALFGYAGNVYEVLRAHKWGCVTGVRSGNTPASLWAEAAAPAASRRNEVALM